MFSVIFFNLVVQYFLFRYLSVISIIMYAPRSQSACYSIHSFNFPSEISVFTMGIGPEGKKASIQLGALAKNPRYNMNGDVSSLIQKASFTMLSGGLLKCKTFRFQL